MASIRKVASSSKGAKELTIKGRTTGFIIWINGNGVLVDPPVQTNG